MAVDDAGRDVTDEPEAVSADDVAAPEEAAPLDLAEVEDAAVPVTSGAAEDAEVGDAVDEQGSAGMESIEDGVTEVLDEVTGEAVSGDAAVETEGGAHVADAAELPTSDLGATGVPEAEAESVDDAEETADGTVGESTDAIDESDDTDTVMTSPEMAADDQGHRCAACGAPLEDGARFCTNCGAPVKELSEPVAGEVDEAKDTVVTAAGDEAVTIGEMPKDVPVPEETEAPTWDAVEDLPEEYVRIPGSAPTSDQVSPDAVEEPGEEGSAASKLAGIRSKVKPWMLIVAGVVVIVAIVVAVIFHNLSEAYGAARALFDEKKYAEAAAAFSELGAYSDASDMATLATLWDEATTLDEAAKKAKVNAEAWGEAADAYEKIEGDEDAAERAERCRNEQTYYESLDLMDEGKWQEARDHFADLMTIGYRDTKDLDLLCLAQMDYEEADKLFDDGKYREAYDTYSSIVDTYGGSDKVPEVFGDIDHTRDLCVTKAWEEIRDGGIANLGPLASSAEEGTVALGDKIIVVVDGHGGSVSSADGTSYTVNVSDRDEASVRGEEGAERDQANSLESAFEGEDFFGVPADRLATSLDEADTYVCIYEYNVQDAASYYPDLPGVKCYDTYTMLITFDLNKDNARASKQVAFHESPSHIMFSDLLKDTYKSFSGEFDKSKAQEVLESLL